MRLADHPVRIPTEGPTCDGANESLGIRQEVDEVGDQLWQVVHHSIHASFRDGTQRQDGRLLDQPVFRDETLLEQGKKNWEESFVKDIGEDIEGSS